ncbi:MAG: hypothetical protein AABO57_17465 [Acidobacteriota bacterium]
MALLYLLTLTADYYWDGITFALQIEKVAKMERDAALLFHQNHLFYNGACYVLYCAARALGLSIRALHLLQVFNAIAGGITVGVFYLIAWRVTHSRHATMISTAALGFSAVWWKVATDADAYVVSMLLMLICASTLLSAKPRWFLAGFALAAAMLVHQLAMLFYPAAIVAVFTNRSVEKKFPFSAKLSALALGATAIVYYLCARFFHDIREPLGVVKWAVSNPGGVSPSWNPLRGLALLPRGNLDMIVGHDLALYRSQGGSIEKVVTLAALLTAICFLVAFVLRVRNAELLRASFSLAPQARARWAACGPVLIAWIGAYSVFLLFWEPWQVLYRAFYLPAFALTLGLGLSTYQTAFPARATALLVATLALFNFAFFISPHMRAASNPSVAAARNANHVWNAKTVIYFLDRNEADTAFEYFNNQTQWRRFTIRERSGIDDEIQNASSQGGQIWLNKGAAESVGSEWLSKRAHGREITLDSPFAPARYVELLPSRYASNSSLPVRHPKLW